MEQDSLFTIKQVAELLNVKISWVKRMIFKKQIPFVKVGKLIRFNRKELGRWVEDRKIQEDSWS